MDKDHIYNVIDVYHRDDSARSLLKSCLSCSTLKLLTIQSRRASRTPRRIKCGSHSGAWRRSTSATRTGRLASRQSPSVPFKKLPMETRTLPMLAQHGKRHCG